MSTAAWIPLGRWACWPLGVLLDGLGRQHVSVSLYVGTTDEEKALEMQFALQIRKFCN